ncbi:integrase [Pseudonocardiaceae bacterium YIM PH 21723]|nr:integrase [Pseudonocardiaceae bacterium YIM PH 21723]
MHVVEAQRLFFVARRPKKDSPHTIAAYRRDLAGVTAILADQLRRPVDELTVDQLTVHSLRLAFGRFADTHAKSSVLRAWSTWNQLLSFCVAEEWIGGNPMGAVTRPRSPAAAPKPLRGEDTPEQLLSAVASGSRPARDPWPERDLLVLALGLVAGLRAAEIRGLTQHSVVGRPGEQRLHVRGKGSRERSIPIAGPMERILAEYRDSLLRRFGKGSLSGRSPLVCGYDGNEIGRGALEYLVRSCYRSAGIGDRVPAGAQLHALRHTFATRLAEDGANATEIMALLGHASLATVQNYIETSDAQKRAAAMSNRTYQLLGELGGG